MICAGRGLNPRPERSTPGQLRARNTITVTAESSTAIKKHHDDFGDSNDSDDDSSGATNA